MTEDDYWKEFVQHLVQAKRELGRAWSILDGVDGAAEESEKALARALDGIPTGSGRARLTRAQDR